MRNTQVDFWTRIERLVGSGDVVIDRPKGTAHPRYPGAVYPVDYGYVTGTTSKDGNEVDIWRGSFPGTALVGIVCTVDTLKNDTEIKVLLGCTKEEIEMVSSFCDASPHMSGIVVERDGNHGQID